MRTEPRRSRALAARLTRSRRASRSSPRPAAPPRRRPPTWRGSASSPASSSRRARSEDVDPAPADGARALGQAPRQPLTADAAVRIALLNNRELCAVLKEVGVARGNLEQAGKLPNPEIAIGVTPLQEGVEHAHLELEVEIDLASALPSPLHAKAARSEHEAATAPRARSSISATRCALRSTPRRRRSSASASRTARLDAFAAARDAARALFEAGNVPELDVATQEAGYEEARVTAAQMELELLSQRERLTRLLGLSGAATSWTIAGAVPAAPEALMTPPRAESLALRASLELAELRSRPEAAAEAPGPCAPRAGCRTWRSACTASGSSARAARRTSTSWVPGAGVHFCSRSSIGVRGLRPRRRRRSTACSSAITGAVDVRSAVRRGAESRLLLAHARAALRARHPPGAQAGAGADAAPVQRDAGRGSSSCSRRAEKQPTPSFAAVEALREHWTAKAAFDALLAGRRVEAAGPELPRRCRGPRPPAKEGIDMDRRAFIHAGAPAAGAAILAGKLAHAQQRPGAPRPPGAPLRPRLAGPRRPGAARRGDAERQHALAARGGRREGRPPRRRPSSTRLPPP